MSSRRRHHKAENLSPQAISIIERGLAGQATFELIARDVEQATGEKIAASSVQRYHAAKFRPRLEATRQANAIAESITEKLSSLDDESLQRAMKLRVAEMLHPALEVLAQEKPEHAAKFFADLDRNRVEQDKIRVKHRELDLRNRQLEAELQMAQAKIDAASAKAKEALGGTKKKTRAELEQAVRDLYGITISDKAGPARVSPVTPGPVSVGEPIAARSAGTSQPPAGLVAAGSGVSTASEERAPARPDSSASPFSTHRGPA